MPWTSLRTIVEDAAASQAADSFSEEFPRFDEAWEGLKWVLARDPRCGLVHVDDDGEPTGYFAYGQASDSLAKTPEIWVVFSFTDHEVVIHDLKASDAPEDDEDAND